MSAPLSGVDAGLLGRFRSAGTQIQWRDVPSAGARRSPPTGPRARIAHLNDEEARVEEHGDLVWVADSGPLGALVLLLEIDRRAEPVELLSRAAGVVVGFDQGGIEARWGPTLTPTPPGPTIRDLVGLARYALA